MIEDIVLKDCKFCLNTFKDNSKLVGENNILSQWWMCKWSLIYMNW